MWLNVQYTPPTPTQRNCQVASCRRCEHTRRQSWPSLQFPVLTTDKWRHCWKNCKNSRLLHYTADSNVCKHAASYVTSYPTSIALAAELYKLDYGHRLRSHRRNRRQSSWASCEFMYTPPTRRDKTVSSRRRRRCVLGLKQFSVARSPGLNDVQCCPTVGGRPSRANVLVGSKNPNHPSFHFRMLGLKIYYK